MGIEGTGILMHIYLLLRQCNGRYPLDSIMALAKGRMQENKVRKVLNNFNLFKIENGIVQLQSGLSAAELKPGSNVMPRDRQGVVCQRLRNGYDDTLFPTEMREMDEEALVHVTEEIRAHNEQELNMLQQ